VKLYDLHGKLILNEQKLTTQENYQFSTNGLSQAVYLAEVFTNDNRKTTQKIIISSK
jgi:fructose-1,6-bisphosphatase/sedoheptulose 1,7-bisphosphatase-like protein